MNPEKIAEGKRLCEAATPGKITVAKCPKPGASTDPRDAGRVYLLRYNDGEFTGEIGIIQGDHSKADADLFAFLRTHATALLSAAERCGELEAVVKERANRGHDWTKCLCVYCEAHRAALRHDGERGGE